MVSVGRNSWYCIVMFLKSLKHQYIRKKLAESQDHLLTTPSDPSQSLKKIKMPHHSFQQHHAGQLSLVTWPMSNLPEQNESNIWSLEDGSRKNSLTMSSSELHELFFHLLTLLEWCVSIPPLTSSFYLVKAYDSSNYSYQAIVSGVQCI